MRPDILLFCSVWGNGAVCNKAVPASDEIAVASNWVQVPSLRVCFCLECLKLQTVSGFCFCFGSLKLFVTFSYFPVGKNVISFGKPIWSHDWMNKWTVFNASFGTPTNQLSWQKYYIIIVTSRVNYMSCEMKLTCRVVILARELLSGMDLPVDYVFENFTWMLTIGND